MIDIKVLEFLGKAREELGNNADSKAIMKKATYLLYSNYFDVIVLKNEITRDKIYTKLIIKCNYSGNDLLHIKVIFKYYDENKKLVDAFEKDLGDNFYGSERTVENEIKDKNSIKSFDWCFSFENRKHNIF